MNSLDNNKYKFLPYNPLFPYLFEQEKSYLQKILGKDIVIEHFGSTSVPGLGGKGVIDIYVLVPKDETKPVSDKLQLNGYIYKADAGNKNRLFFQIDKIYGNNSCHYHIHLSFPGNKDYEACIAFRDHLRTHPEAAKQYAEIKLVALKEIKNPANKEESKRIYMEVKKKVIRKIIRSLK